MEFCLGTTTATGTKIVDIFAATDKITSLPRPRPARCNGDNYFLERLASRETTEHSKHV